MEEILLGVILEVGFILQLLEHDCHCWFHCSLVSFTAHFLVVPFEVRGCERILGVSITVGSVLGLIVFLWGSRINGSCCQVDLELGNFYWV